MTIRIHAQQAPLFTQYLYEPVLYQPAAMGTSETPKIMLGHRSQWVGINDAPSSQLIGFSGYQINDGPLAFGGVLSNDRAHLFQQSQASIFVGYQLFPQTSSHTFSIGGSVGARLDRLDLEGDVQIIDQGDPLVLGKSYRRLNLDAGLGTLYQYHQGENYFYVSLNSTQLPQAFELDGGLQHFFRNHVLATVGGRIPVNSQFTICPVIMWRGLSGVYAIGGGGVDVGVQVRLLENRLWIGGGARPQGGGIHALFGLDFDKFSLTAIYERNNWLGTSLEFGASIPVSTFSTASQTPAPSPSSPKKAIAKRPAKSKANSKKRVAFWKESDSLQARLALVDELPDHSSVKSFPSSRVVLIQYQFAAEEDEYLPSKTPELENMLEHIGGIVKEILDESKRPHLEEISSIRLISFLQEDESILQVPAYVKYRGEWGDQIIKTYELDGEVIADIIDKGKINRQQEAILKLISIQKSLSANLNQSENKFEYSLKTGVSSDYLKEIIIEVILK